MGELKDTALAGRGQVADMFGDHLYGKNRIRGHYLAFHTLDAYTTVVLMVTF